MYIHSSVHSVQNFCSFSPYNRVLCMGWCSAPHNRFVVPTTCAAFCLNRTMSRACLAVPQHNLNWVSVASVCIHWKCTADSINMFRSLVAPCSCEWRRENEKCSVKANKLYNATCTQCENHIVIFYHHCVVSTATVLLNTAGPYRVVVFISLMLTPIVTLFCVLCKILPSSSPPLSLSTCQHKTFLGSSWDRQYGILTISIVRWV